MIIKDETIQNLKKVMFVMAGVGASALVAMEAFQKNNKTVIVDPIDDGVSVEVIDTTVAKIKPPRKPRANTRLDNKSFEAGA